MDKVLTTARSSSSVAWGEGQLNRIGRFAALLSEQRYRLQFLREDGRQRTLLMVAIALGYATSAPNDFVFFDGRPGLFALAVASRIGLFGIGIFGAIVLRRARWPRQQDRIFHAALVAFAVALSSSCMSPLESTPWRGHREHGDQPHPRQQRLRRAQHLPTPYEANAIDRGRIHRRNLPRIEPKGRAVCQPVIHGQPPFPIAPRIEPPVAEHVTHQPVARRRAGRVFARQLVEPSDRRMQLREASTESVAGTATRAAAIVSSIDQPSTIETQSTHGYTMACNR